MTTAQEEKAESILNSIRDGMAEWPGTKPLHGKFGFLVFGSYFGPGDASLIACAGAASLFIWLSAVIPLARYYSHTVLNEPDTPGSLLVFVYIAGGILTIMLAKYVLVPLLGGQVDVEITEDDIRIREPSSFLRPFRRQAVVPRKDHARYAIRKEQHQRIAQDHLKGRKPPDRYLRSYEIVVRYLERRYVVAAIQSNETQADNLLIRLQTLMALTDNPAGAAFGDRR
jgi:hypothetical protein